MDLLDALRAKLESLQEGDYSQGLRAVLLHISTAFRHLARGQKEGDETAFTDAIYRTNQAFEGSIKEAYRVLAAKDPERVRPFDIESYLEKKSIFRPRVLSQFTNYRRGWRNPSTHDYKLDFDESECLLAIVSVSAFAMLLFDQIAGHLAYARAKEQAEANKASIAKNASLKNGDLLERTAELLKEFSRLRLESGSVISRVSEAQLMDALAGFLASAAPNLNVNVAHGGASVRPDVVVSDGGTTVVIEVKGFYRVGSVVGGLAQLEYNMRAVGAEAGILYFYPAGRSDRELEVSLPERLEGRVVIMTPRKSGPNPGPQADV